MANLASSSDLLLPFGAISQVLTSNDLPFVALRLVGH